MPGRHPLLRTAALVAVGALLAGCGAQDSSAGDRVTGAEGVSEQGYVSGDGTTTIIAAAERQPAPELTGATLDGDTFVLADHLGEVPAIVLFLQPILPWTPSDGDGEMDIGRLDASVYPAVQNFCVAARAHGLGTALTTVIRIHAAEVLALLAVPTRADGSPRFEIAALVPVGYPAGRFGVALRKAAASVTHWECWGGASPVTR